MQFKVFEEGIKVNGQTVYSIVSGFGHFQKMASEYLLAEGIGSLDENGKLAIKKNGWYPQEAWLRCFEKIALKVGDSVLHKIGKSIPENAQFPPWVVDVESGIKSVNFAYHMNHQKSGQVMFNPDTGEMLDGIGSYGFHKIEGENMIISECKNPYPDDFDRGILTAMARKFNLTAKVIHDDAKPCRKNGADSCTYIISWQDL